MNDDFSRYEALKVAGVSPEDVYRQATRDEVDAITRIRLIRSVYGLSPAQAKEVVARSNGDGQSLDEQQARIANELIRWATEAEIT